MSERYTEAELALLSDTEREALTATDVDDEGLAEIAGDDDDGEDDADERLREGPPCALEQVEQLCLGHGAWSFQSDGPPGFGGPGIVVGARSQRGQSSA